MRPTPKHLIMPIYTNLSFWVYFCCSILSNILIDIALYLCNLTDQQSSKRKHICNIFYCNKEQEFIYIYISIVCYSTIKLRRINNLKHIVSSPSDWYRNHLHREISKVYAIYTDITLYTRCVSWEVFGNFSAGCPLFV